MPRRLPALAFATLALALLAMTLAWHVPMMLWDHLDLVPLVQAWREGRLHEAGFVRLYGGHVLLAPWMVLLADAVASAGTAWLDCLLSWLLLVTGAALAWGFVRRSFPAGMPATPIIRSLLALLLLYPGHLANLQWGWQVAVFLCLAGTMACLRLLCSPRLDQPRNLLALAAALLACASFSTGLALLPVAVLVIFLRGELPQRRRLLLALPWLVTCAAVAGAAVGHAGQHLGHAPLAELHYLLNYLGAGISRFATDLAPVLALAGLAAALLLAWQARKDADTRPWIALLAFSLLAGGLIALGRAVPFGPNQAFASRYVSFSSLFWLALAALLARRWRDGGGRPCAIALGAITVFATANALHLVHKAARLGAETRATAAAIRDTWPNVDRQLLGEIYFEQPATARERLARLHDWRWPPFDRPASEPPPVTDRR